MASIGLRVEDRLDGGGNWTLWRARIALLLEEYELWEIVETAIVVPTDLVLLAKFKKKNIKAKRITLDSVKDHIIPYVAGRDFAFHIWESLSNLYQSSNQNRKMVLREKLRSTKMARGESVTTYLTKVSQVRDELAVVGETMDSAKLIRVALNGFSKSWETFIWGIVSRENMPSWEQLWDDFKQEELQVGSVSSSDQHGGDVLASLSLAWSV